MEPFPVLDPALPPLSPTRLRAALRRIDGFGPGAWREILTTWRVGRRGAIVSFEDPDTDTPIASRARPRVELRAVARPRWLAGVAAESDRVACADWVLRRAWADWLDAEELPVEGWRPGPGEAIRPQTACAIRPPWPGAAPAVVLRLRVGLPFAGMGIDGRGLRRFVERAGGWLDRLTAGPWPGLEAQRASVRRQQAMRAALPAAGLVAFIADGSVLPRGPDGGPLAGARPLRAPRAWRTSLTLADGSRVRGLGIRPGVTGITGAPYHGKSTLVGAIAGGGDDHPPGDGRDGVVSLAGTQMVCADPGRLIRGHDLSPFFARLPDAAGRLAPARSFSTGNASGATSMAAAVIEAISAGSRLLCLDEDSAAANFLAIDPALAALIGAGADDAGGLLARLPRLRAAGISLVIAVGASARTLAACDRAVVMHRYVPRDATAALGRLRRAVGRPALARSGARSGARSAARATASPWPQRVLTAEPETLFAGRHRLPVVVADPRRPRIDPEGGGAGAVSIDLSGCGVRLDGPRVRGACLAAAWCCRLAAGRPTPLADLRARIESAIATHGAAALDPYGTTVVAWPGWALVAAVLERHPGVGLRSRP